MFLILKVFLIEETGRLEFLRNTKICCPLPKTISPHTHFLSGLFERGETSGVSKVFLGKRRLLNFLFRVDTSGKRIRGAVNSCRKD